ncbi:MAG: OmpA family protein [Myxococcota bacterium]
MRRLHTSSPLLRKVPGSRWTAILAGFVATAMLATVGCVAASKHQQVFDQKTAAQGRIVFLERSNASLDEDRVRLVARVDDLGAENTALEADLGVLAGHRAELERELRESRDELAARSFEVESLRGAYDSLVGDLESEVAAGQIEIQRLRDGIEVNVSDRLLFDSGRADLNPEGRAVILRVATQLAGTGGRIEVLGHTDDLAIRKSLSGRYPSNWELGGARAAAVVRVFEEEGIAPERLSAVSRGSAAPRVPNDSAASRARNRRIEIRVLPEEPQAEEASPRLEAADPAEST